MKNTLLIALLALASPVLAQQPAPQIPISTIPVVITKPGHYYFVGNLYYNAPLPSSPPTAITVNAPGPVIIDMRGFALNGSQRYEFPTGGSTVYPTGILIQSSNVTVESGGITGFWNGITVQGSTIAYLTGINLEGIEFLSSGNDGTFFNYTNGALVKNCRYVNGYAGAYDMPSQTGNYYINNSVVNCQNPNFAFIVASPFNSSKISYIYTAVPSIQK